MTRNESSTAGDMSADAVHSQTKVLASFAPAGKVRALAAATLPEALAFDAAVDLGEGGAASFGIDDGGERAPGHHVVR